MINAHCLSGLVLGLLSFLVCAATIANEPVYVELMPRNANKSEGLLRVEIPEFSPARDELHGFQFALKTPGRVDLNVVSADGDVIRQLSNNEPFETGQHSIEWDGRDEDGQIVPDEAYIPVFIASNDNGQVIDDPRRYSGGEIIFDVQWSLRGDTELSYTLDNPARVLIRSGVENGPMMRELLHWKPVNAGKAVMRWDGFDKDGVEQFAARDDVWFVVMAYRLPEYSVITTGNTELDYIAYRKAKGWKTPVPDLAGIELQRDGVRLEQDYFLPRAYLPEVSLEFAQELEVSRVGLPVARESIQLRIDVPKEDRWILDSSFYETGFYIDYQFQSEEEQGFVPLIWEYDASNLAPGRHIATVQLFGFGGFISSDTVEFLITP